MRWLAAILLLIGLAAPAVAQKRIALSFDDAPRQPGAFLTPQDRANRLVKGLRQARVRQAVFFVTTGNMANPANGDGAAQLRRYVAAGHVLANHTDTHPKLSDVDAAAYLADLDKADHWLRAQPGFRPWFRYPYLDEGGRDKTKRDAIRAGLAARGLTNGYVTAESSDWNMESLAVAAKKVGKKIDMAALRDLYVESHVEAAEFYDRLAIATTGRSPVHILLLHETDIAALFIGDLVKALRARGWMIVTADEAYADPIAIEATRYDTPFAQGTLTEMLAWQKKLPAPRWYERNDIELANRLFAERVLGEKGK